MLGSLRTGPTLYLKHTFGAIRYQVPT